MIKAAARTGFGAKGLVKSGQGGRREPSSVNARSRQARALRISLLSATALVGVAMPVAGHAQTPTGNQPNRNSWAQGVEDARGTVVVGTATTGSGAVGTNGDVAVTTEAAGVFSGTQFSNQNSIYDGNTNNAVVTYTFSDPVFGFNINYAGFGTAGAPARLSYAINGGPVIDLVVANANNDPNILQNGFAGVFGYPTNQPVNSVTFFTRSTGDAVSGFQQIAYALPNIRDALTTLTQVNDRAVAPTFDGGTIIATAAGGAMQTLAPLIQIRSTGGTYNIDPGVTLTQTGALTNWTSASGSGATEAGSITKSGTGTLVLTAANTYSGGTTINGGTLQGTVTSFGAGAIVDNATLAIVQPASGTLANAVSGTGVITVNGLTAGNTLTFGGALTNTGGMVISNTSSVRINASANGGILENGAGNRTLTIAGNATNATANTNASGLFVQTTSGITTLIVNSGATLATTAGSGNNRDGVTALTNTAITNAGTISSNFNAGVALAGGGSINSTGTITGGNGGNGYGIAVSSGVPASVTLGTASVVSGAQGGVAFQSTGTGANSATLSNAGQISSARFGVEAAGTGTPTITNATTGKIVGGSGGIVSTGTGAISNAGTIGTGTLDAGGNFVVGGAGFAVQIASGSVTNTGTINSTGSSVYQTSTAGTLNLVNTGTIGGAPRALDPDDTVVALGTATILNSGTITTPRFYGVAMMRGGALINAAGGIISAGDQDNNRYGVVVGGASGTIDNYGTIRSTSTDQSRGIQTDNNAATINLYAGSTTGAIATGSGNDMLTLFNGQVNAAAVTTTRTDPVTGQVLTVTLQNAGTLAAASVGAINLGLGTDTIVLRGVGDGGPAGAAGSIAIGGGAEIVRKLDAGTWTLTGATASAAAIMAGDGGGNDGLLIFNGTTGLTGAITVNGAVIRADSGGAFGSGTITTVNPTVIYNASGTFSNNIVLASTNPATDPTRLQATSGTVATLTGTITESNAGQPLVFDGPGQIILTNAQNYSGGTTISNGRVTEQNVLPTVGTITINSGAVLELNRTSGTVFLNGVTVNGAGTLEKTGAGMIASRSLIAQSVGGLLDVRAGTFVGSSDGQGRFTGNLGSLNVESGATFVTSESLAVFDRLTGAGTVGTDVSGNFTVGINNGTATFIGSIVNQNGTPGGKLAKVGTGTQTLAGALTYTGGTTIAGGTLRLLNISSASGTTQIDSGATLDLANTNAASANVSVVVGPSTFTGTGMLVKSGTGNSSFGGNGLVNINLSQGAVIDVQGGLLAGSSSFQGIWTNNRASLNVAAGATFNGVEGTIFVDALTGSGTVLGGQGGVARTTTVGVAGGSGTFAGVIGDFTGDPNSKLALTKVGTGTQTLTSVNTYTGATTISGGTLALAGAGTIAQSAGVTNNATFSIAAADGARTVNQLTGTGNVVLGANTLTANNANAGTIAGVISGAGGFTKAGAGTLTLTAANTYTGATGVTGGTLQLGNGGAASTLATSAVAINGGATLAFNQNVSGTFSAPISGAGQVTVAGLVAAGASNGNTLTFSGVQSQTGNFTISDASNVTFTGNFTGNGTIRVNGGTFTNLASITSDNIIVSRGIVTNGSATNTGATITGGQQGVIVQGDGDTTVNNFGRITSNAFAAVVKQSGTGAFTINNNANAVIYGAGNGGFGFGISDQAGTGLTVVNASGAMIVGTLLGVSSVVPGAVTNSGLIGVGTVAGSTFTRATSNAAGQGAAIVFAIGGSVVNTSSGNIQGSSDTTFGQAQQAGIANDTGTLVVDNAGAISGGVWGVTAGRGALDLTNRVSGTISGTTNNAAYTGGGAGSIVRNAGTMTGGNAGVYGDGTGLVVMNTGLIRQVGGVSDTVTSGIYSSNAGTQITNGGTIESIVAAGLGIFLQGGTGTITNQAGGVIAGPGFALLLGGSGYTVDLQAGSTTSGGIDASATTGSNAFTLAGTSTGTVTTGTGDDTVTRVTGGTQTGAIDTGAGTDTLVLTGTGTGSQSLAEVLGIETLRKRDAGTWTLTGAAATPAVSIFAGDGPSGGDAGLLIFDGTTALTGPIYVNGGIIRSTATDSFGSGTIFMVDPTVQFTGTQTSNNPYVLTVASPASADPNTFQTVGAAATVTLNGAITTGTGNNINGQAIDPNQFVTFTGVSGSSFVLGNAANAWTGTTTINSGITLRGTTATISGGSIVDNGTLNFNQAVSGTSARNVSGTGSIIVNGLAAGNAVTLSGALTNSGGIFVTDASTLTLSGTGSSTATGVRLTGANATLNVAASGAYTTSSQIAVQGTAANATVNNLGLIRSTGGGRPVGVGLDGGGTINNGSATNSAAVIRGFNTGINNVNGANLVTVNNYGTIVGDRFNGIDGGALTIANFGGGTIVGLNQGVAATGATTDIANQGLISSGTLSGGAVTVGASGNGVRFDGAGGGIVVNATGGIIQGGFTGINSFGTGALRVENAGTITGTGNGNGIIVQSTVAAATTVINTGTIAVNNATAGNQAWGVGYFSGGTITNTGSISGDQAIEVQGAAGVTVINGAAGSLNGLSNSIRRSDTGTLDFTNYGAASGALAHSSSGVATIVLQAGSTTGAITTGAGDDSLTLYNGLVIGTAVIDPTTGLTLRDAGTFAQAAVGTIDLAGGTNTLVLRGTGDDTAANGAAGTLDLTTLTNVSALTKEDAGRWTLVGNSTFAGPTTITAGTLVVDGSTVSATTVMSGAILTGGGSVGATVVADGGILAGVQGATLTLASLGLSAGSVIDATFSAPGGAALFGVTGDLVLDGTVNVASTGAFGFGVYRLASYGGVLTDNGLVVGTTPAGAQRTTVQTAVAGQVNLVSSSSELSFWDGGNAALYNNGAVDGGTGSWTATAPTFTDANGLFNGPMTPQPGFAVFQAAAGTVTVDGSAGAIAVTGMQFAADGYVVTGDAIGLAAPTTAIRVGDGTAAGAAFTATIGSALTGANGLDKTDLGTLILTGTNSYAGATTVSGGTLVLAGGQAIADGNAVQVGAAGTLTLAASERIGTVGGAGAVVLGANTLALGAGSSVYTGVASGTGGITVDGGGMLTLAGANSYTGTTQVTGATLVFGASNVLADASTLSLAGATATLGANSDTVAVLIANNAVLDGTGTLTAARYTLGGSTVNANLGGGTLANTGGASVLNGMAAATAVNVDGGSLSLGASNRLADTAVVTVASGGTLNIAGFTDTVGTLALTGTLDGTGTLSAASYTLTGGTANANLGAGTLVQASGASTLNGTAGATAVNVTGGTLSLGASNRLADGAAVSVASGGTLNIAAFTDTVGSLALAGTLNGTGTLTAATYTLTGGTANANLGAGTLLQASGASTLNGSSAASTLTVSGGSLRLNGTAAATTVAVNAGSLSLGASNRLADTAAVSVASGAILDLAAFSDTVGSLALGGTLNGSGTLSAASYTLNAGTVNANLGAGTLTTTGGVSTLNGTAAAATVNVTAGTLRLGAANRLADASAVTVASGAILDLAAFGDTVGTLALGGTLNGSGTLSAASYTLNAATVNANLGAGTLTQAGGVSTLAGSAGAATVNVTAGTLRLAGDERLVDTSAVTIAGGATFDLNGRTETVATLTGTGTTALGAGRLVLAGAAASSLGALTGTGNVDKTGTGTLTLANAYASTGSINTAAGTTVFTGSSAGSLRVTGGTLTGTGTAAGTLTLTGGTVSPGVAGATNGTQFGTLSVGGLTASGGAYAIDFGGAASGFASDLIRVAGTAALSGTVAVAPVSFAGNDRFQQTYTIIQANAVTGTFANGQAFSAVGNDGSLFYRLRYDLVPNAVVLQVQRQIDFRAVLAPGTVNQRAVAGALNGAAGLASDSFAGTLNAIAGSGGNRGATFDSLSGEAITDVTSDALFASDLFVELMRARIGVGRSTQDNAQYALRAGMAGDTRASGFAGQLQDGVNADGGTAGAQDGAGVWLQGYGAGRRLRGLAGQARTNSFVDGLAGGIDGRFGNVTLGLAGGFSTIDTSVRARNSQLGGTLYQGGGYVAYEGTNLYGSVSGSYYQGDVTVTRQLALGGSPVGRATGTPQVDGYAVGGLLGVRFEVGGGTQAGIEVKATQTRATRDAYTETAPLGLNLTAQRDARDVFSGTAQVKLAHRYTGNGWTATPYAAGGVRFNSGDLDTLGTMQFGGAPTGTGGFIVQGATLERTTGVFTGGIEIRPSDKFRIDLSAGGAIGNRTREGQIKVSARLGF